MRITSAARLCHACLLISLAASFLSFSAFAAAATAAATASAAAARAAAAAAAMAGSIGGGFGLRYLPLPIGTERVNAYAEVSWCDAPWVPTGELRYGAFGCRRPVLRGTLSTNSVHEHRVGRGMGGGLDSNPLLLNRCHVIVSLRVSVSPVRVGPCARGVAFPSPAGRHRLGFVGRLCLHNRGLRISTPATS